MIRRKSDKCFFFPKNKEKGVQKQIYRGREMFGTTALEPASKLHYKIPRHIEMGIRRV